MNMAGMLHTIWWTFMIIFSNISSLAHAEDLVFVSAYSDNKIYTTTIPDDDDSTFPFTTLIDDSDIGASAGLRTVVYDPVEKKVYWIEYSNRKIGRCNVDGTTVEHSVTTGRGPWGLALDIVNRIIYYSDYSTDGVSSLAMADFTSGSSSLISGTETGPGDNPRQIAYGAETTSLYVAYSSGTEEVAQYDVSGSGKTTLFSAGLGDTITKPSGVYVDEVAQELVYGDEDADTISRLDLRDMTTKTNIFTGSGQPRGMDTYGDYLYFCDFSKDNVYRIPKDGSAPSGATKLSVTLDGASGDVDGCSDIHFYKELVACVDNLVVTTDSSDQLSVTWDAPTSACPADLFQVSYEAIDVDQCSASVSDTGTMEWQDGTSAVLENLIPYTSYNITVTAALLDLSDSSVMREGMSEDAVQDTDEDVPTGPPEDLVIQSEYPFTYSWAEIPCGNRSGVIVSYRYNVISDGEIIHTGVTSNREVTINYDNVVDDLPCGMITFEVAGATNLGVSLEFNNVTHEILSSGPFEPSTQVSISKIGEFSASVSWVPSQCPPSNYTLTCDALDRDAHPEIWSEIASEPPVILTGLEPGSSYQVSVKGSTAKDVERTRTQTFRTKLPPIRLAGGSSKYAGRIEIFVDGAWGTICKLNGDPSFSNEQEAKVTCRHMGFPHSNAKRIHELTPEMQAASDVPIHYSGVDCMGNEDCLVNCTITCVNVPADDSCTHADDVAISCSNVDYIFPDFIQTYDGVLDYSSSDRPESALNHRVFRVQEGAVVKFICPTDGQIGVNTQTNNEHMTMYWELGGDKITTDDAPDGVEVEDIFQMYQNRGLGFNGRRGKRLSTVTYTARKEDTLKVLRCRLNDEDPADYVDTHSLYGNGAAIKLLVLPPPSPLTFQSTILHAWTGGFIGDILIPIDAFYNSWKMILKFPKPVFRIYGGHFNIAEEPCLHKGSCSKSHQTWILYNIYENRVLSPLKDLHLTFIADVSKKLNRGRGRGLEADIKFYGYNKVFGSDARAIWEPWE